LAKGLTYLLSITLDCGGKMKIFMDDERVTPEGWERTYTVEETKEKLLTRKVTHLSLDNDLGSLDHTTEGYNVLDWLEEQVYNDPTFPVPEMTVHSANASRAQYMRLAIKKLENIRQQQVGGF
jgi:hypothetical protein